MGAKTWAIAPQPTGDPISIVISSAIGCISAWRAADTLVRMAALSVGAIRGQGPSSNAVRAALTARSMSVVVASGTRPITSSVVGLITSIVPVPAGDVHSPPMNNRS